MIAASVQSDVDGVSKRSHEANIYRPAGDVCDLLCLDLPRAEALRRGAPDATVLDAAAARSKALGDPTRLAVATALARGGELCVCDLAWIVERDEKLVSHHLRALRTAGLVRSRATAGW